MLRNSGVTDQEIVNGVRALVFDCAEVKHGDKVYIISNPSTAHLGEIIEQAAATVTDSIEHQILEEFKIHGQEPMPEVAVKMLKATVVFCISKMSMAHTAARLQANLNGVKYYSLPDYSNEVMSSKALLTDFKKIRPVSEKIAELLTNGKQVRVITDNGTDLIMNIEGRTANPAPGFCYNGVLLASPPDAETNIAPNEYLTNGKAVIDGSIPCKEIGLLDSPITLDIKDGFVKNITGKKSETLNKLFDQQNNPKCRIIAEFGIGLNSLAELKGAMLEDEGTLGTVHLGMGSNKTIGGLNDVPFHLDHVIRSATVLIDEEPIMHNGILVETLVNLKNPGI